ncbi:hypothetical protein [Raoultella terrigena]|nr:hypothetical protein EDF76_0223 [Raoultella terrigena]
MAISVEEMKARGREDDLPGDIADWHGMHSAQAMLISEGYK